MLLRIRKNFRRFLKIRRWQSYFLLLFIKLKDFLHYLNFEIQRLQNLTVFTPEYEEYFFNNLLKLILNYKDAFLSEFSSS